MATGGGIATERSPSFSLPLRFFLLGVVGYVLAMAAVAVFGLELSAGTTWTPRLLAITHVFALGFIVPMIIGACYQLVPVVLLATIRHEWLGKLGFWPYTLGAGLLVAGFWSWQPLALALGGALVAVGLMVFLAVLVLSLAKGAEWGEVAGYVGASLGALVAASAIGLARVIGFAAPGLAVAIPNALNAHASLATLGGASLLIYGVSYRLVPMFAVGHELNRFGKPVLALAGAGVAAVAIGSLAVMPLAVRLGLASAALAAALWAYDAWQLFRSRTRRRLDTGLWYAATAIVYLLIGSALGLALACGALAGVRWAMGYALLGLVGWIGFSIVGYFHKILPFLAWYHRFSSLLGKQKVPLIRDLFDERSAWVGFWASQLGLVVLLIALIAGLSPGVHLGGALLLVGALAMARVVVECLTKSA